MEVGISYALGFSVIIIILIAVLTLVVFFRTDNRDGADAAILFLAMAIDAGVLIFIYLRVKKNDEIRRSLINSRATAINITECPNYYTRSGDGCVSTFQGKVVGGDGQTPETVKISGEGGINDKLKRDEQCSDTWLRRPLSGGGTEARVWTQLQNGCS